MDGGTLKSTFTFTYFLTAGVIGAPQMTSQPVSSISVCLPPPSGTWQTPGLLTSSCCLPTSFSVCLVFFPLSLFLARLFWPGLMNGRRVHTTSVLSLYGTIQLHKTGQYSCIKQKYKNNRKKEDDNEENKEE